MTAYYNEHVTYLPGDTVYLSPGDVINTADWNHTDCNEGPDHNWCIWEKRSPGSTTVTSTWPGNANVSTAPGSVNWAQPNEDFWDAPPVAEQEPPYTPSQQQSFQQWAQAEAMKKTPKDPLNLPLAQAFNMAKTLLQEGDIGLEIEAEGKSLFNSPISFWNCHVDQSLRHVDQHPPIEYVLKAPLSRKGISDALTYLSKKLKAAGSEIRMSYRCSVHVHVNCQRLTMKQIYQFILLYMIFEEMLVDFSGKDRVGNFFCLRAKDAEYWVKVLQDSVKTMNFMELFNDNWRYTSCNTASLGKFGSLEFRSMRGTVDQKLIETWVDLLCHIRDVAIDFDSPKAIAEFFVAAGPTKFFNAVFEDAPSLKEALQGKKTTAERNKSLWDGLRLMRDVAYSTDWDKKYEPPVKKPSVPLWEVTVDDLD